MRTATAESGNVMPRVTFNDSVIEESSLIATPIGIAKRKLATLVVVVPSEFFAVTVA
jgi:hypothetical protein